MKPNEGTVDRMLRLSAGIISLGTALAVWPGTLALVLLAVSVLAIATSVAGWCPAYSLFGVSTCHRKT